MLGNLQHIQVAVRCRPTNDREKKLNGCSVIECNEKRREVIVSDRASVSNTKTFTFDRVFGPLSKQIEVYNQVVKPVVMEVIEGYNCTIFAYGQTGTGKTFTMEGERSPNSSELTWEEDPFVGIIPRSVSQLFSVLNTLNCCEYSVKISFIELYNEELSDLLSDSLENEKLRIFDDPARKGSVIIPGLEEIVVQNKSEVYKILQKGAEKRQKASTLMNSQSSRSHSIFTVTVFIKEKSIDGEESIKVGKLNLVDLAGSENIERSGATGKRAAEAGKINKSLTTLGRVITALVEHRDHIPYRESNLTRLLQDSLGGRTKTSIIATISPAQCNIEETMSTLDYAYKAKSIKNKPEVNQKLVKKALIKEYTEEIERLKRELCATREKNGIYLPEELYTNMEMKIENQKEEIRDLLSKINALNDEIDKLQELFKEASENLQEKTVQLTETKGKLQTTEVKLAQTEIELDENKYLLSEQVTTETNLYSQADHLLKTAKLSIDDCGSLHNKLDRKHGIDKHNELSTNLYAERMNKRGEHFILSKNENFEHNSERLRRLETNLDGVNKRLEENKDENTCALSMYQDKQDNWAEVQSRLLSECCLSSVLEFKEAGVKLNTKNLNENLNFLVAIQRRLSENFSQNALLNKNLHEYLQLYENYLKIHQAKLNDEIEFYENNLAKRLQARTSRESDELNEIGAQIGAISNKLSNLNEQKNQIRDTMMGKLESMTQMLSSLKQTVNDEMSYFDSEITSTKNELNGQFNKLGAFVKQQKVTEGELIAESKLDFGKNVHELSAMIFDETFAKLAQLRCTAKSLDENTNRNRDYSDESVGHLKSVIQEDSTKLNGLITSQMGDLESKIQQVGENLKVNKKESEIFMSNFIEQCITNETSNLTSVIEESIKLTVNTQDSLNAFNNEINEFIVENARILEQYTKQDLKIDVPSGSTPQRRTFILPNDLYRTQPHPLLLEQYREEVKTIRKCSSKVNLQEQGKVKNEGNSRSSSLDSVSSSTSLKSSSTAVDDVNKENTRGQNIVVDTATKANSLLKIPNAVIKKTTLGVRNN